jgi:hypothetical protein
VSFDNRPDYHCNDAFCTIQRLVKQTGFNSFSLFKSSRPLFRVSTRTIISICVLTASINTFTQKIGLNNTMGSARTCHKKDHHLCHVVQYPDRIEHGNNSESKVHKE